MIAIKSIEISDFKGIKHMTITPDCKNVKISAMNGSGKTTISDAHLWLFTDRDSNLVSNPPITPNYGGEYTSIVTEKISNGVMTIEVSKSQKVKTSKPDENGVVKKTTTNTYKINGVPKTERDFKEYLTSFGINFDDFLYLSVPMMFLLGIKDKKGSQAMREMLFRTVNPKSDLEIAKEHCFDSIELIRLLESGYKLDEVVAMNKATIKRIDELFGKDNEIALARIEGLEKAKEGIDYKFAEENFKSVSERYNIVKADYASKVEEAEKLRKVINRLEQQMHDKEFEIKNSMMKSIVDKYDELIEMRRAIDNSMLEYANMKNQFSVNRSTLKTLISNIETKISEIYESKPSVGQFDESEWIWDEKSENCPTCGAKLNASVINKKKKEFEEKKLLAKKAIESSIEAFNKEKAEKMDKLKFDMATANEKVKLVDDAVKELDEKINIKSKERKKVSEDIAKISNTKDSIVVDLNGNPEYRGLEISLNETKKTLSTTDAEMVALEKNLDGIVLEYSSAQSMLDLANRDKRIDSEIESIRNSIVEQSQNRADAEKVLYQVDVFSKTKNEMLSDEINKNFKIVKFQLFEYLKNGTYKESCIPFIDIKDYRSACNTGLQVLAQLDVIRGLQNAFNQHYPVFLDGAESLDSTTLSKIDVPCQLITLSVSDDADMRIEVA